VLWLSPTVAGGLTATEPAAPNLKIATAFVIHDASNGTLMVRAEQGNDLHSDQRVQVSGLTNNDVLTWNNANQRWQNAQPVSNNIYTSNGTIGTTRFATLTDTLSFSGGRVSFDTTTNGILLPRLTTIQMNAIASPTTNTILYNTDLNGLYRYNGSAWVALSAGYGIIEVQSGSGSGVPTFFATLQSALETCKASGGYFTVKLYSNIVITSAIEIDYTGSGTGKAYQFRQLTIDFNGFSVTNAQANTTDAFTLQLSNTASVYQEIRLINGNIIRTNGTSTHHALNCSTINRFGTMQMSKMFVYCQNSIAARIELTPSTNAQASRLNDLGGSAFISNSTYSRCLEVGAGGMICCNFSALHTGSGSDTDTLRIKGGLVYNFSVENTGNGRGIIGLSSVFTASNFIAKSNSGTAVFLSGSGVEAHHFVAESVSGIGIDATETSLITNFKTKTGDNRALRLEVFASAKNGYCQNNSNSVGAVTFRNADKLINVEGVNLGNSFGGRIENAVALYGNIKECYFRSIGGIACEVVSTDVNTKLDVCTFESQLNTSGGHTLRVVSNTGGTFNITKCNFIVRNSGANAVNATVATTIKSFGNTHNEVASTPINANVTITALASF